MPANRELRVLLVHGTLDHPGGGNAVGAWIAQALGGAVSLEVLTERPWDPDAVDAFWGTSLARTPPRQHVVPMPGSLLLRLRRRLNNERAGTRFDRLRLALVFREARRIGPRVDLCITAENFAVFDRPGIQYVLYPATLRPEPVAAAPLMRRYYDACDANGSDHGDRGARPRLAPGPHAAIHRVARGSGPHAEDAGAG